jgi:hypothetical protein
MEHEIRGIVEKIIDQYLTPEQIQRISIVINNFQHLINSKPDAIFGWLMGAMDTGFSTLVLASKRRLPTNDERIELNNILIRRSFEIMNFIRKEAMR